MALPGTPKRVSVPSVAAPTAGVTVPFAARSAVMIAAVPITNRIAAAANSAQPCFLSPTITPKVLVNATGIKSIATISTTLVSGVWVLEGMGAVDVEGAATVTRHQLDRFPRGHGAAKNGLTS